MHSPRLLVVDLDGTALTEDDRLLDEDRDAARRLAAIGVPVTIATGRLLAGARWVADALQTPGTIAVMNGSARFHVPEARFEHLDAFDPVTQVALGEWLTSHDLAGFLFEPETIHLDQHHDAAYGKYLRIWTPNLRHHNGEAWHQQDQVLAIGVSGRHDVLVPLEAELRTRFPHLSHLAFDTFSGERWVELRPSRQDKGTALRALARHYGCAPEEVVAVGDWLNDLPLLRAAGHPYAMGGAIPELVALADGELTSRRGHGGAIAELAHRIWKV